MCEAFDPDRFVVAQDAVLAQVRSELMAGQKRTHWMWFVFPQLIGLGSSYMAQHYALRSMQDASLYLAHSVLGPRLIEFTALANSIEGRSVQQIFGDPDDLKFHASMTLFSRVRPEERAFSTALLKYFDSAPHRLTVGKLSL